MFKSTCKYKNRIRKEVVIVAKLKLNGGCVYCNLLLETTDSNYISSETKSQLTSNPFIDYEWNDNTTLRINFNENSLSGSNFDGTYGGVKYFKIYKTFSKQPKYHKVFTTKDIKSCIVEDFAVGSDCEYTYYLVPVCEVTDERGTYETVGSLVQSTPITLDDGIVRVIGLIQDKNDFNNQDKNDLIQDKNDFNKYHIDTHNIWHFSLNLTNDGFTNNMAKTYTDTLHQYQKEIKGNGNYRTLSVQGLLGKYDCEAGEYVDTYDDIIEWEEFMNNDELKLLIDRRGIMSLGSIDSNSFQYETLDNHSVSVNFNFRQLEDINNVQIINRRLPVNPLNHNLLADNTNTALMSTEDDNINAFLASTEGGL